MQSPIIRELLSLPCNRRSSRSLAACPRLSSFLCARLRLSRQTSWWSAVRSRAWIWLASSSFTTYVSAGRVPGALSVQPFP